MAKINSSMTNLIVYVTVLFVTIFLLGIVFNFVFGNLNYYDSSISESTEYNLLNMYILNTLSKPDVRINDYGQIEDDEYSYYIDFVSGQNHYKFIRLDDIIYFNDAKLCENVNEFKVVVDKSEKTIMHVELMINATVYNMQYSVN